MQNREAWLSEAVTELIPVLKKCKLEFPPESIRVSCGFPSKGGASKERRVTGETWPSTATFDKSIQIFISPLEDEPTMVLGILLRELIHASLPDDEGCGPDYKAACKAVGLEGRAKNMTPGMALISELDLLADRLGDYPNKHIILAEKEKLEKPKKKTTFTLFCPFKRNDGERTSDLIVDEEEDGLRVDSGNCANKCLIRDKAVGEDYSVAMHTKKLQLGFPSCVCGHEMVLEEEDFKVWTKANPGTE